MPGFTPQAMVNAMEGLVSLSDAEFLLKDEGIKKAIEEHLQGLEKFNKKKEEQKELFNLALEELTIQQLIELKTFLIVLKNLIEVEWQKEEALREHEIKTSTENQKETTRIIQADNKGLLGEESDSSVEKIKQEVSAAQKTVQELIAVENQLKTATDSFNKAHAEWRENVNKPAMNEIANQIAQNIKDPISSQLGLPVEVRSVAKELTDNLKENVVKAITGLSDILSLMKGPYKGIAQNYYDIVLEEFNDPQRATAETLKKFSVHIALQAQLKGFSLFEQYGNNVNQSTVLQRHGISIENSTGEKNTMSYALTQVNSPVLSTQFQRIAEHSKNSTNLLLPQQAQIFELQHKRDQLKNDLGSRVSSLQQLQEKAPESAKQNISQIIQTVTPVLNSPESDNKAASRPQRSR